MGQANRVKKLIKQIANGENHEPFHAYLAQVLTDAECSGYTIGTDGKKVAYFPNYNNYVGRDTCLSQANLTIAVKLVTDQSNNSGLGDTYGNVPNQTILSNVTLMCDVDDGPYIIPTQGSSVIVGISGSLLPPFILQYSSVSGYNNSSSYKGGSILTSANGNSGETFLVTKNDDNGNPISGSVFQQKKDEISLGISDGLEVTYGPTGISVNETGTNTTNYVQNINLISIGKVNGASLTIGNKFNVINDSGDLKDILTKVNNNLTTLNDNLGILVNLLVSTFASGSFPAAVGTYNAGYLPIINNITNISVNLSEINNEIDNVLGNP